MQNNCLDSIKKFDLDTCSNKLINIYEKDNNYGCRTND